jgi:hypothetical protein
VSPVRPPTGLGAGPDRTRGRRWDALHARLTTGWATSAIDGAPRWAAGLVSGVQAALLSLAVVIAPALATYVATSADPTNANVGWERSAAVASSLWLLAHGVPLVTGTATVTLMPLGLSGLVVFACYASARRSGRATRSGFFAGVAGYAVCVILVAVVVDRNPQGLVLAAVGGTVVGTLGLGAGLLARPGAPSWRETSRPAWSRVPALVRVSVTGGLLGLALLVLLACALVLTWVIGGRATISDILGGLGLDPVGGVVFGLAESTLVPNLVVWALAWLAGPGFAVGAGSQFSPGGVVAGPLPALPVLGALPQPDMAGGILRWAPVVLVLVGAVAGVWTHRRRETGRWWEPAAAGLSVAVTAGVGAAVLVVLASGSAGPGRMLTVGAGAALIGSVVGAEILVGTLLVGLPADREVRAAVARRVRGLARSGQGDVVSKPLRTESSELR